VKKQIKRRTPVASEHCFESTLPSWLVQLYAMRGINSDAELETSLENLLSYHELLQIDEAVIGLANCMLSEKNILIIGDYDADGATSTALAMAAFRAMGYEKINFLVPDRFKQGYGLSEALVAKALDYKPDLIITVDNGIANHAGVKLARDAGVAVLITDHHLCAQTLPDANWIVNPNQIGCPFPSKNLAGVGVIFYVLLALRQHLKQIGWFEGRSIAVPNMAQFLDLVALGTVADLVPLDRNNRILVEQGLRRIRGGFARPGIKALIDVAKRHAKRLRATDFSFALGPRLNAAGRLEDMSIGIQCLLAKDDKTARQYALLLDNLNEERKEIEAVMQEEAMQALQLCHATLSEVPAGICVFQSNWHQGVIGILASRLKEYYHHPVIAFALDNEKEIKGSARSVPGVHIRDILQTIDIRYPGMILKYGGHAMAAGLTIALSDYEKFQTVFAQTIASQTDKTLLSPILVTDGSLQPEAFCLAGAQAIAYGGPWGQGFPEPLFDDEFDIVGQTILAGKHVKFQLCLVTGGPIFDGLLFFADLKEWPNYTCQRARIVYRLDINEYNGVSRIQLIISLIEASAEFSYVM
jgi:single-stranded-DNA-specific exonuclease